MRTLASIIILVTLACASAASASYPCRSVSHLQQDYIVCTFDPSRDALRIYGARETGKPETYRSVRGMLREEREYMIFGMNGGMYHTDYRPVGLLVENGRETSPLNRDSGSGNFFLKPNGVFYVERGRAGVMESDAFARAGLKPLHATQSGPMLVVEGRIHPRFLPKSDSLNLRNGVGIDENGNVVFAISRHAVRFHDFARLFRDELACRDALYLDGSISSLYAPAIKRNDSHAAMGTVIAVVETLPF